VAFSDDTIGFFLKLDDQLTPALSSASKSYTRFVDAIDRANRTAQRSAERGLGALSDLARSFADVPKSMADEYAKAIGRLRRRIKPIVQSVEFDFSAGRRGGGRGISKELGSMLRSATIRLSATVPLRKSPLFEPGGLRAAYRTQPQPPDYRGRFQGIPKFAKGGVVGGNKGDKALMDKVLAFLTPGEIVLPKAVGDQLREMNIGKPPKMVKSLVADVTNLANAMGHVRDAAELGLDPDAPELYEKGLASLEAKMKDLIGRTRQMSTQTQRKFAPTLRGLTDRLADVSKQAEESTVSVRGFGAVKFVAISEAIKRVSAGFAQFLSSSKPLISTVGGGDVASMAEGMNDLRKVMPIKELRAAKGELAGMAKATKGLGVLDVRNAFSALRGTLRFTTEDAIAYAKSVGLMVTATDLSAASVGLLVKSMGQVTSTSREQREAVLATVNAMGDYSNATDEIVSSSLSQFLSSAGSEMKNLGLTGEQQAGVMKSVATAAAAAETAFAGGGQALTTLLSTALSTDPTVAAEALGPLGMSADGLAKILAGPGGPVKIMAILKDRMGDTQGAALALKGLFHLTGDEAGKFAGSMDDAVAAAADLSEQIVPTGKGTDSLGAAATNAKTAFQRLSDWVGAAMANFRAFGVSTLDVFDAVNELSPALVLLGAGAIKGVVKKIYAMGIAETVSGQATGAWSARLVVHTAITKAWAVAQGIATAATTAWSVAVRVLGAAWKTTLGPIAIIIGVVGLLVAGFVLLNKKFHIVSKAVSFFTSLWADLNAWFTRVTGGMQLIPTLLEAAKKALYVVTLPMRLIIKGISAVFGWLNRIGVFSAMLKAFGVYWSLIGKAVSFIVRPIKAIFGFLSPVVSMFGRFLGITKETDDALTTNSLVPSFGMLADMLERVGGFLRNLVQPALEAVKVVVKAVQTVVLTAMDKIEAIIMRVWESIKAPITSILGLASKGAGLVASGLGRLFGGAEATAMHGRVLPTAKQIGSVITVRLAADTTDRPVLRAVETLHEDMVAMLAVLRASTPGSPAAMPQPIGIQASPVVGSRTSSIADGGL